MNIIREARAYIDDYGRCSYSPIECFYLIEGLLAALETREIRVQGKADSIIFDNPQGGLK